MAIVKVLDRNGEQKENIELNDNIFNVEIKSHLMHEVVKAYLTNQRQGTKGTKSRGAVKGSTAKLFKQKGTGRARAGSKKNPIWKGGGHAFALTSKVYDVRVPKSKRRAALKSALSSKFKDEKLIVLEDFTLENYKTKDIASIYDNLKIYDTVLLVLPEKDEKIYKSAKNILGSETMIAKDLNTYQVLKNKYIILIKSAVNKIEENLK